MLRDSFSDTDDEGDLGLDGLLYTTSGQRRTVGAKKTQSVKPHIRTRINKPNNQFPVPTFTCHSVSAVECDNGVMVGKDAAYGTKIPVAVAPVSLTASATDAKTGRSRWVVPAFLGFVPPTTLVPVDENNYN